MKSLLQNFTSELRADLLSAKAVPALAVGFTSGLGLLVAQVAFGSFIFSGPLASYSSQGVGLVLFGNFATCLIIALAGGYLGAIAGLSPALVIVMATIGFTMDAEGDALFVTTAVALIISAVATGACCLMIGYFRLANLVRFIPYPVAGGFVAGIGGAVCLAALSLMGAKPDWRAIPSLFEPSVLWKWSPGAAYGTALYLAMKRWNNPLILPVSVALAGAAYHFALATFGISGDAARAEGLLLSSTADRNLWPALFPADLAQVQWASMAEQLPHMLALMLVAFISVVMNFAGLELAVNQELDWDREFRVTGVASVVSGLGGGTVATLVVPASLRSKLSKELQTGLEHNLPPAVYAELLVEPDADRALERCEDIVIAEWRDMADERRSSLLEHTVDDLERYLERQIDFENLLEKLRPWLSPRQYAADEALVGPDVPQEGLQLLLSGRASGYDSAGTRLFQRGPGEAIWPAGAAEQRATSVIADDPCQAMVLPPTALGWLEQHEERLTLNLYRHLLAGRLQSESGAEEQEQPYNKR
ncbi:MAG: SulP family inorganic anion transporter [Gemmatimonadetes bacterium]|nr:SulP family inorganic anion transporter [Gemmatimonadota bacterium]